MSLTRALGRLRDAYLQADAPSPAPPSPHPLADALAALRKDLNAVKRLLALSLGKQCSVCLEVFPEFVAFHDRQHARCPKCDSLERHRAAWLYLQQRTPLFERPLRMLHIAPEGCLRRLLEPLIHVDYTPTSYDPAKPDEGVDIQRMPFGPNTFDLIYCCHVLEHIPDDRRAMREIFRVLAPGGLAVIMVPLRNDPVTYEDASITTDEERARHFGRFDHLRWYGRDFPARLRDAGFDVTIEYFTDRLAMADRVRFGLISEPVFACRKSPEA